MNSHAAVFAFVISVSLAFFCGMWLWLIASSWNVTQLRDILVECQKDLPRSQTCELVAVAKK